MENMNPPPTNNPPVLPTALHAKVVQELKELQTISAYIDSRIENIDQFLNGFENRPNEINGDSDDGEVLSELEEYGNAGSGGGLILYQAYGNLYAMTALGWLLEEIRVTWEHLEKKRTRLRLYTKSFEEIIIQKVEMASPTLATTSELDQDSVRNITTASKCSHLK
ncbi:hypothetical protein Tco_0462887 [Tanacetum coccineum]